MTAGQYIARTSLAVTARDLSAKLKAMSGLFLELDGIVYTRRSNGSGGGKHAFTYARTWEDEPEEDEANLFTAELTQLHN